ncbi:MAG TPA: hypothetical protein VLS86_05395, partial [Acidimicrobiia bacterium]|nr:hypothetical protein [Acidimicrobiia bacterium]
EQGENMTEDEKSGVDTALAALKLTLENDAAETTEIRSRVDELIKASQAMATRLYEQAAQQSQVGEEVAADDDENIVEAEIIDDDDEA